MTRVIHSLAIYAYMVGATAFHGVSAIILALFRPRAAECRCPEYARRWARGILKVSRTPVVVEGLEHIRPDRAQIFISNHESWYDIFALAAHIPGAFRFVAKRELARVPVLGRAIRACGHVFVDRGDHASALESMKRVGERIRREPGTVVILPEGTRTRTGKMLPFKKGAFVLGIQAQVPIVPAGLAGSRAVLPKGDWRVTPGPIRLVIGAPIDTQGLTLHDRDRLLETARDRVAELRARAAAAVAAGEGARAQVGERVSA